MRAISEKTSKILPGIKTFALDTGRIVITSAQVQRAFGLADTSVRPTEDGAAKVPRFLASRNLNPFIDAD